MWKRYGPGLRGRAGTAVLGAAVTAVLVAGCSGGGSSGPEEIGDRAEFTRRAAALCGEVVDRRGENGHDDRTTVVIEGVVAVKRGQQPAPETVQALGATADEHRQTLRDLARITPADPQWAAAWSQVADAVRHQLRKAEDRAAALASGDADRVQAAFQPDASAPDISTPLRTLELAERDCRFLAR